LFESEGGGNEGAGFFGSFNDKRALGESGDNSVSPNKMMLFRFRSRRVLGNNRAPFSNDVFGKRPVLGRIERIPIGAAADYRKCGEVRFERGTMSFAVNAEGEA